MLILYVIPIKLLFVEYSTIVLSMCIKIMQWVPGAVINAPGTVCQLEAVANSAAHVAKGLGGNNSCDENNGSKTYCFFSAG